MSSTSTQHFSATHLSQEVPAGMYEWQHAAHTLHVGVAPVSVHVCDGGGGGVGCGFGRTGAFK